ncbi:hypothetical protein DPMN_152796 [Dreissena polymorpha]|uniref:Uncharacterized protein n=1 Tax=Dreissena polymorpha TaxID=45954 RepID=A0A9D4J5H4_DREPO|nr:hypothetical protein DPMN_152796 [Dreissena polymorpha]
MTGQLRDSDKTQLEQWIGQGKNSLPCCTVQSKMTVPHRSSTRNVTTRAPPSSWYTMRMDPCLVAILLQTELPA